jgi:hypothetical protein
MKTRNGKIARLPRMVRDELNQRLENGEPEGTILPWLNGLAAVQAVLTAGFGGGPVKPQNLTNWRQGGYPEWLKEHEHRDLVRQVAQDAKEFGEEANSPGLASHLSTVLVAELAVSASKAGTEATDPEAQCDRLRELLQTVSMVRREDYRTGQLALEQEITKRKAETASARGAGRIKVNQGQSR